MSRTRINTVGLLLCALGLSLSASTRAQQTSGKRSEVWPEVDVFVPLNRKFRLLFIASVNQERETKNATEGKVGVHLDYLWKDALSFRVGYRYIFSLDNSDPFKEHRIVIEQTYHRSLGHQFTLHDRNREELRWVDGDFSARYRNRLMVEYETKIFRHPLIPYASAEAYYDSRFNTFNRTRYQAGLQIPLRQRDLWLLFPRHQRVVEIYYSRQLDTRSEPRHLNAFGITFTWHF